MTEANRGHDPEQVNRLLAGAASAIKNVRYCWLVTEAEDGGANPRAMGRLLQGEDAWTIGFVVDGRSRKVADMRREGRVTLIFQHDGDDAYLTLFGRATLYDSAAEVRARWKAAYAAYFPTESDRANAMFVEVPVERMELWIRGVTPEPFGMRATILQRNDGSDRRLSFR